MNYETMRKITEQVISSGNRKVKATYDDGHTDTLRLFISGNGDICYYKRHSHKRGYILPSSVISITPITSLARKSKEQKWIDAWTKVINRLKVSGLWEVVIQEAQTALNVGYERMQQAYQRYNAIPYGEKRQEGEVEFAKDFPELTFKNDEGKTCINSTIIWTYHDLPKVKKMRFTKWGNEERLQAIQKAMSEKRTFSQHGKYGYDITFEYNPEKNKAWYSEEFSGTGNGHYYIALDSTHCLFCEDD